MKAGEATCFRFHLWDLSVVRYIALLRRAYRFYMIEIRNQYAEYIDAATQVLTDEVQGINR